MEGDYSSSGEEDELDDVAPGYRVVRRAEQRGLSTWQSHTGALAQAERQIYRERSDSPDGSASGK